MEKQYHIIVTDREEGVVRDVETDAFCMLVDEDKKIATTIGAKCGPATWVELTECKETVKAFFEMLLNEDNEEQS